MGIDPKRSLQYLSPKIAIQWHETKNGSKTASDVTNKSNKTAWWQCPDVDEHEWEAKISDVTRKDEVSCPHCKKLVFRFPLIAKEWHPTKNATPTAGDISYGSNEKVWWQCSDNPEHIWDATVANRTLKKTGCRICNSNDVVTDQNSLATLSPDIAKQWHPTRNKPLKPNQVRNASEKIVWWQCMHEKTHEWQNKISNRTVAKESLCPICNSLAFLSPDIAKQWHPTKNHLLTPKEVSNKSKKKVWWQCPLFAHHEWEAAISDRTREDRPTGCPCCYGRQVTPENSLATLFPDVAKEWHPTKNGSLKPEDVNKGSDQKVWWQCLRVKKHVWEASVSSRTNPNQPRGCRSCGGQSSIPEIRVLAELSGIFKNVVPQYVIDRKEIDIFLPDISIGVEHDGVYFHGKPEKIKFDLSKNEFYKKKGITIIRLRAFGLDKLSTSDLLLGKEGITKNIINQLLMTISQEVNLRKVDLLIDVDQYIALKGFYKEELFQEMLSNFPSPPPYKSLQILFPEIAKEWHPIKNEPFTPRDVSKSSDKKVWWQCANFPEYQRDAVVKSRIRLVEPTGCLICRGQKLSPEKSLATLSSKVAKEWHPKKNGSLIPAKVFNKSNQTVGGNVQKIQIMSGRQLLLIEQKAVAFLNV